MAPASMAEDRINRCRRHGKASDRGGRRMDDNLSLYEKAYFLRAFEMAVASAFDAGRVPGLVHLSNGSEFLALAVAAALDRNTDRVTASHRCHAIALALGADPLRVACEILGRADGLSGGLAGTQHLIAPETGLLAANGIVGGQVPLAAGAALAAKTRKTGGMAAVLFGDGAANQGAVMETMNLAAALRLPLLFILENNGIAQATSATAATGGRSLTARARGFSMAVEQADGTQPDRLVQIVERLAGYCRTTLEPAFLEVHVPRLTGHYHGASSVVAEASEERGCPADPLTMFRERLPGPDRSEADLLALEERISARARAVLDDACRRPPAEPGALTRWQATLEPVQ